MVIALYPTNIKGRWWAIIGPIAEINKTRVGIDVADTPATPVLDAAIRGYVAVVKAAIYITPDDTIAYAAFTIIKCGIVIRFVAYYRAVGNSSTAT